jgi:hypothetical protein
VEQVAPRYRPFRGLAFFYYNVWLTTRLEQPAPRLVRIKVVEESNRQMHRIWDYSDWMLAHIITDSREICQDILRDLD